MRLETLFLTGVLMLWSTHTCSGQKAANAPHEPNAIAPRTIKPVSGRLDLLDIGRVIEDKLSL